jgi:carboxyl-terminal processing protease
MRYLLLLLLASTIVTGPVGLAYAQDSDTPAQSEDGEDANPEDGVMREEPKEKAPPEKPDEIYKNLDLFGDVLQRVRDQYVDETTSKQLIEAAINGMLTSLDAHSSYLNEDDFKDMRIQTSGEFGGLGIEVTMDNGLVKVVSPIDDTPAYRAGVKPGDYVSHLDGKPVMGLSLSEAVDKMRGKVGEPIELTIRREGVAEPIKIVIKRDVIRIRPVKQELEGKDDTVGYIRVTTFNQYTAAELKDAIAKVQKAKGDQVSGYILDLRNNPGGLLDQAIEVADLFLERGEIVSTRGREEADTQRDNATPGDMINGLPLVVLINGGSASASEIVAGALQDHRRAVVMGTQSFGKGSVQTVIPVASNGAIRLTTARYYTPSGRSIQAKGIVPDIMVEQAKIEKIDNIMDLKEADLLHALSNPDQAEALKNLPSDTKVELKAVFPWDKAKEETKDEATEKAKKLAEDAQAADFQLQRAVDLIQGLAMTSGWQETPAPADAPVKADKDKEAAAKIEPQAQKEAPAAKSAPAKADPAKAKEPAKAE